MTLFNHYIEGRKKMNDKDFELLGEKFINDFGLKPVRNKKVKGVDHLTGNVYKWDNQYFKVQGIGRRLYSIVNG